MKDDDKPRISTGFWGTSFTRDTELPVVAAGAISALLLVAAGGATSGTPSDFA